MKKIATYLKILFLSSSLLGIQYSFGQYPLCANTVSTFPYNEGFETGLGLWVNSAGDNFDWTRDSGGTPSSNTGPANGNATSTWYMYIETSWPRVTGDVANFESPCFDLSACATPEVTFAYHMYGASTGSLLLEVESTLGSGIWITIWTLAGDQGNVWNSATVSLAAYVGTSIKLRFRGLRGTSYSGDIAVDDLAVSCTPTAGCSPSSLTTLYVNNNGHDGVMFDVTASNALIVSCFDGNWDPGTYDCEIYYKVGTHVGFEGNAAAWTLAGSSVGATSNGNNISSPIPITISVAIGAGQTYAFYITNTGGAQADINYTNGSAIGNLLASDGNLSIYEGTGKSYPFAGSFVPREFNGTIYYTTVLPVELVSFDVECNETKQLITWATASEINNEKFILQRSTNAIHFEDLIEVPGNGNSSNYKSYFLEDEVTNKTYYYRLKQVDFNGDFKMSDVIVSDCKSINSEIALYPNPANDLIHMDITTESSSRYVQIFDIVGNEVYSNKFQFETGYNKVKIDISDLANGVYLVIVAGDGVNSFATKLIKQQH